MMVGQLIFLWCVLLCRRMSCAGLRVTIRASIAECRCHELNSLWVRMPVTPAASATLAASIFSKVFSRQERNEIGLWLLGEPRWVFPGLEIGMHFVNFQGFGKAPNFRKVLNWSGSVCLYVLARAFIIPYDTRLAPTAEFILLLRITSFTVSAETA